MKLYEVIKPIESPEFTRTLEIGRKIPEAVVRNWFGPEYDKRPRFFEFFKVCISHKVENCQIIPIDE